MPSPSIEFPYRKRYEGGAIFLVPVILAELRTPHAVYPIRLLLDSGADYTMLSRALDELAGIDVQSLPKTKVKGVGGQSRDRRIAYCRSSVVANPLSVHGFG